MHSRPLPAILLAAVAIFWGTAIAAEPEVGDLAPPGLGVSADGREVSATDYAGKVLAVTFWASWCAPCLRELPMLEAIQKTAGRNQIQVVAINIEDRQQFRRLSRALSDFQLLITHDSTGQSAIAFGNKAVPHLIIIGRDGRIQKVHKGYSEKMLDSIIAEVNAALLAKH